VLDECIYFMIIMEHIGTSKVKFQINFLETIKTHFLCSVTFFLKNLAVCKKMWEKYCRARQDTDHNKALAHCMLGN
jgi:hypothetical protein